jgi:hypothetical protein
MDFRLFWGLLRLNGRMHDPFVGVDLHWIEGCTKTAEALAGRGFQNASVAASIELKDTQSVGACSH